MAYSKSFVVVIFSWVFVFVGFSHGINLDKNMIAALFSTGVSGGNDGIGKGVVSAMPCVKKLVTCQLALASHTKNPPLTCCVPLKEMVSNDEKCFCTIFSKGDVMKSLNVTEDEALNFAKSCGAKPDLSVCKNVTSPGSGPSASTNGSNSSNNTANPPAQNTASVTSKFGGFVAVASFISSVLLAF